MGQKKPSVIEQIAQKLRIIPDLHSNVGGTLNSIAEPDKLTNFPPPEQWNDWVEYEAKSWPVREKKHYSIVPTTCFNCESACGLTAFIDKDTNTIRKLEGNPYHPGSRGRNCAKGPATINQIKDPERILYPLKRKGKRGSGEWERVSWDEVLDDVGGRIEKALREGRQNEIAYHVGRPGDEGFTNRVLQSWGIDGHNSHTNICSGGARAGYALWYGHDRPSPDHTNAKFILLISAHLESGHYFNPHAQRIIEGKLKGATLAVMDPRLSNTASMADYWMPTYPGSEAAIMLAWVKILLDDGTYNREYMENWVNWQEYMEATHPNEKDQSFDNFIEKVKEEYAQFTPEYAAQESGLKAEMIVEIGKKIGAAGDRFASHTWRSASIGNLGGWAVSRALHFLSVVTGSVGSVGGTAPNSWSKFKPELFDVPPKQKFWNELHYPAEYPLAFFEMSFLLPHMLKEKTRGKLDVYFTRVFNPVWTYPDGFSWIEALSNEDIVGCHIAMTPTWNETAYYADYVIPMGHSAERHDINSYATHSGKWVAFRQPVLREAARREGKKVEFTYEVNPGEVWEEDEFWIELSWRIDKNGDLGIRDHFISPYRKGEKINLDEYYQYIFERIKGLPDAAKKDGFSGPFAELEYMRKYGAFLIEPHTYKLNEKNISADKLEGSTVDEKTGVIYKNGKDIGVMVNGEACEGFPTPSRKNEFYSQTMVDWKWPEYAIPQYIKSHIHPDNLNKENDEYCLVPNFRLPTLIHSRSGNAKWLIEISNRNPIWMHPQEADKFGFKTGDLVKINTDIGYFVDKVWVTQSIKPGIVACSHHIGRWKRPEDKLGSRWASNTVKIENKENGTWSMKTVRGISPFKSEDNDSSRIFWTDGGVHQNITHAVHPDPVSGHHAWLQRVKIEVPGPNDSYGDISVDTNKAFENYKEWLAMARPAPGPNNLRRPLWMKRAVRCDDSAYYFPEND